MLEVEAGVASGCTAQKKRSELLLNIINFIKSINIVDIINIMDITNVNNIKINILTIIFININIMNTRPKPAYGRQGLAGFWGQDTDQAGSFWGVLNVSLRAYGAQLGFKPTRKMKNHKKQPGITKHLHGTMNNPNNYLEPKITIKFHL